MTAGQVGAGVIAGRKRLATIVLALGVLALPASSPASAPGWGAPVNISPPGRDASSPQVALNAAGTAVAVWRLRVSRSTEIVQAAVREAGGTWGPPRDISMPSEVDPNGIQPLHVALDPGGNAVAIWSQRAGDLNSVVTAVLPAAGNWSPPQQISTPGRNANGPRVALDPTGNAVAVWSEYDNHFWWESRVLAAVRPARGTWSAPQSISPDGEPAYAPQVAIAPSGTAIGVWSEGRDCERGICTYAVRAAVRPAGGAWGPPEDLAVASYTGSTSAPQVAVSAAGDAIALWSRETEYGVFAVESALRPAGGSWSSPEVLARITTLYAPGPRLAVDSTGDAVAVWSPGYRLTNVVASTRPAGGTWEEPTVLSRSMWENSRPDVAVDAGGATVVIWERFNIVWIAERPAGGTWGRPQNVSSLGRYAYEPAIALGATGSGLLVWHQFDGSNEVVQAAERPGPPPCVVPKVVGKTVARAKAAIAASNCRTGKIARTSSKARKGQVLSQSPPAGLILNGGTRVNLAVSRGRRR